MPHRRRLVARAFAFWLLAFPVINRDVSAADVAAPTFVAPTFTDPARRARIDAVLPTLDELYDSLAREKHLPGLIYGVVVDGTLIHHRAFGLANIADQTPVTATTRFRIASMTKSLVALAILQLRDAGKLTLDDPVAHHVPTFASVKPPLADAPTITLRHLLTMSSGLPEDNPWGDRQMANPTAQTEALLASGLSFSTAPGSGYEYSNLGYIVLGDVVTRVSGQRFQDYIRDHLLTPLGMAHTGWDYTAVPPADLALGYRWDGAAWQTEPILDDGDGAAMGGLITTLADFARYTAFLLDAWPARDAADTGPVRRATVRELQQPRVYASFITAHRPDGTPNTTVGFYAYGLRWSRDQRGVVKVQHSGGLPGYGSIVRLAPDHGIAVIAFTNLRYGGVYAPTDQALDQLIDRAALPTRTPAPSPILQRRYEQVRQLVQTWDTTLAHDLAAMNLFLDTPLADRRAQGQALLASIGAIRAIHPIVAENQLRGSFTVTGETGTLTVRFTLSPEPSAPVQELELSATTKL